MSVWEGCAEAFGGPDDAVGAADGDAAGEVGIGSTMVDEEEDGGAYASDDDGVLSAGAELGASVGSDSGFGVTVVNCVTITTGGGSSGVVGSAAVSVVEESAGDSSGATDAVGTAAAYELCGCAEGVFWASVGTADSRGDASGKDGAALDGVGDW